MGILRFMTRKARRARLVALLEEAQRLELELVNVVAQVVDLTEPGDVVHLQMQELLEALER